LSGSKARGSYVKNVAPSKILVHNVKRASYVL
jgi:hypothetical protein